jgi:hypothetical protein
VTRPLLFLDIDGVLNPFPDTPAGFEEYDFFPADDEPVRLAARHVDWLGELVAVFDVVWASGWGEDANRVLSPFFGLPELPLVDLPAIPFEPLEKVPGVALLAGDRPAAWVDDNLGPEALAWAEQRRAPTLLVAVDSATGLTRAAVEQLLDWARCLSRPDEAG